MDFIISLCHFCELHGPKVILVTQSLIKETASNLQILPNADCELNKCQACFPLNNNHFKGFKSCNSSEEIIYVSSSCTIIPELSPVTKQCCIRSISCEQYPGQWGTIYYGCDNDDCHVMACKFPLKDFHARGFQQTFCINILSQDKSELLCNWSFVATKVNDIISWLQHFSKTEFEHDGKLPRQSGYAKSSVYSQKQSRSLLNITNNENIMEELHLKFSHLLNDIYDRYDVKSHEYISSPPIMNLNQIEESDGFIKILDNSKSNILHSEEIDLLEFVGNMYPRILCEFLGHSNFEMLLHHIVIGNQIIVRCNQQPIIKSVIDCLLNFLPKNCIEFCYFSNAYLESSNLIGLPLIPTLPTIQRACLILDISGNILNESKNLSDNEKIENPLINRHFIITHENLPNGRPSVPAYVDKIIQFLKNENLDHEVINLCINALKIEWINKVKSYEKYITMMNSVSKKDVEKLLQIIGASTNDMDLINFWKIIK